MFFRVSTEQNTHLQVFLLLLLFCFFLSVTITVQLLFAGTTEMDVCVFTQVEILCNKIWK